MNYDEELDNESEELENGSDNNLEKTQPAENEPETNDSLNEEKDEEEKKKAKVKAFIKKKILAFLLTHPFLVIGIIIVIILIFMIIIIAMDFDMGGTTIPKAEMYSGNNKCNRIHLVSETDEYKKSNSYSPITNPEDVDINDTTRFSYKDYDINKYIAGIIWQDNQNAHDVDNKVVYELMSIATRSRIISSIPENCVVLKEHNSENFTELTGSEEKYEDINKAVNSTGGLIIARGEKAIDAKYDTFSYIKKSQENVDGKENIGVYYMMNKNKEGGQIIPASWVEEKNVPTKKVLNSTNLESLSLYGSKYLLEKKDSLYDLYRVLEYYYGKDIEYYTIKTGTANSDCSEINFFETPLSKEEFISLVTAHLANVNTTTARIFTENAGKIYDLGKEMEANPELIYIIARKEYGWRDNNFTLSCNNFYGYGVYNGQLTGVCFDTFEDGVKKMLQYVHDKGSLDAFTKVYSYIGTYLANPGSSDDGGCYYLTLADIFGPNYSRCNPSYRCASSNGGAGCILTTDEEKQAYIDWQAKKMINHRMAIFNLGGDNCDAGAGLDGSTEGATFLNETIESFLISQNSSLEEYNNKIIDYGCKHQGTGTGVAYVAATAVSELAKYGKKFNYIWGGMHGSAPSTYGVPAAWGPNGPDFGPTGPDCSGFVNWALYNVGFSWKGLGATGWGSLGEITNLGDERAQIGDFIVTPGSRGFNHIVIITAIHQEEEYYTVVHAQGQAYGVVFSKVPFSANRKLALMSNYYSTAARNSDFTNMCNARGGSNEET